MTLVFDAEQVRNLLPFDRCMAAIRKVMPQLSAGVTVQLPRGILPLQDKILGVMAGALSHDGVFGAKILGVTNSLAQSGRTSHHGLVLLFDGASGVPLCIADAEEITLIRTAAASAVATDLLARPDAASLGIFGCGAQARAHIEAIACVRSLDRIVVWGRSYEKARSFAAEAASSLSLPVVAVEEAEKAAMSDIVCTVTASSRPVLKGSWIRKGSHINVVGASRRDQCETDKQAVIRSRYFADSRASVMLEGGEFLAAMDAGAINPDHLIGEIGELLAAEVIGRTSAEDITLYKSLGHIAQDLSVLEAIYRAHQKKVLRS